MTQGPLVEHFGFWLYRQLNATAPLSGLWQVSGLEGSGLQQAQCQVVAPPDGAHFKALGRGPGGGDVRQ